MVLGILPWGIWTYTFFWDLTKTLNMDGGTQAIAWDPLTGTAIYHYIPFHMTVFDPYIGVQVRSDYCSIWCNRHTTCGDCASDRYCTWHLSTDTCLPATNKLMHRLADNTPFSTTTNAGTDTSSTPRGYIENDPNYVTFRESCPVCEGYNNDEFMCLKTIGCGWCPFEARCVTGRFNWPLTPSTTATGARYMDGSPGSGYGYTARHNWHYPPRCTAVQWTPPGACLKFSYNEKRAFGPFGLIDSFGFNPVTGWPANHPKVYAGVAGGAVSTPTSGLTTSAGDTIYPTTYWSTTGALNYNNVASAEYPSAVSFYAYNYPNAGAPNTGDYESDDILIYVLVDNTAAAYMVMVIDSPFDNDSGMLVMNMTTTATNATILQHEKQPDFVTMSGVNLEVYNLVWRWTGGEADGLVFGPMPPTNWSISFNINTELTYGLANLQVASYDSSSARVSFTSMRVKKLDAAYGGGRIDSLGCSNYCQIYDNCDECQKDSRCQFAPLNGGCISNIVIVESYDCAAPPVPSPKLFADGGTTMALKIRRPERMYTVCPCTFHYYVVVFDMNMMEVAHQPYVPIREGHRFTNTLIPGVQQNTRYTVWVWACSQDLCATTALVEEVLTGYD
mmetsp:Transcript_58687/g.155884  ORF Transcript_58687/g.155884 Transcript_58687/m.155884 type:complete len:616 (+) Transcript_58687:652-2499(+)